LLYFSGFSLQNEKELFKEYLTKSNYQVSGFSYGAIKAFEYLLSTTQRVDKLILLSPAFFQENDHKFIRIQLLHYKKNSSLYTENFLKNISYPCNMDLTKYLKEDSYEDLKKLLTYRWEEEKLNQLKQRAIDIEVHLGGLDKIINHKKAYEFFKPFATIYYYKNKGHTLCKL